MCLKIIFNTLIIYLLCKMQLIVLTIYCKKIFANSEKIENYGINKTEC